MPEKPKNHRSRLLRTVVFLFNVAILAGVVWGLLRHPKSPVPEHWNPYMPLVVSAPVTPLTGWKLDRTANDPELCLAALDPVTEMATLPSLKATEHCGIDIRVRLSKVGISRVDPVETACATALRMAMWERHVLQPLAQAQFGSDIAQIRHIGSYNCRAIRGSQTRMSTHATAEAIDITGFDLANGRRIRLVQHWSDEGPDADFLRQARDGACRWFETTLGPDYNNLHADHFHLQSRGWGLCR